MNPDRIRNSRGFLPGVAEIKVVGPLEAFRRRFTPSVGATITMLRSWGYRCAGIRLYRDRGHVEAQGPGTGCLIRHDHCSRAEGEAVPKRWLAGAAWLQTNHKQNHRMSIGLHPVVYGLAYTGLLDGRRSRHMAPCGWTWRSLPASKWKKAPSS